MVGERIGHYQILEEIGSGGMGVVFRARDELLARDVALKFLSQSADSSSRHRLLEEAQAASALNHSHICTIYEVVAEAQRPFIAMEYVAGCSLRDAIPPEGLPQESVTRFGAQIADALRHAHEHGVVHRDLKSLNVRLSAEGDAKILDFGLARRLSAGELDEVTRSVAEPPMEFVGGTLQYMAPEIYRGEPATPGSDIWSLGIVLYEMWTGMLPFRGRTGFELSSAVLRDSPAFPEKTPPGLRAIIQRCLAKDPSQRYHNAGEVRAALEAAATSSESAFHVPLRTAQREVRAWVAAAVISAVLLGMFWGDIRERLRESSEPDVRALAVLPLANLSGSAEEDYFADGMTEALITELAQIGSLRVVARHSVMQFRASRKPLPQIARELRVDALLTGSLVRVGDKVAVSVQLIRASNELTLWARRYDASVGDLLALYADVARAVSGEVHAALSPQDRESLAKKKTVNPRAYELYLKGRYFWNKYEFQKALQTFRAAIDLDPTYAVAYVGLADCYWGLSGLTVPPTEAMPKARAAARKALELDNSLAAAHASLANIQMAYDWEWEAAEQAFRAAIARSPSYETARQYYGIYLVYVGRFDAAQREFEHALQLDPLSPTLATVSGWVWYHSRRYDQALKTAQSAIDLEPSFFPAYLSAGMAFEGLGRYSDALAAYEKAASLAGYPSPRAFVARAHALLGRRNKALQILGELAPTVAQYPASSYLMATAYTALGEKDRAFEWLERAFRDRSEELLILKVDPKLDSLRDDPRLDSLLRRMNLLR